MKIVFQYIAYLLWPPYRRSCERDFAWWKCIDAINHLILREECDRDDLDAAKFLNNHARQFIPNKVS